MHPQSLYDALVREHERAARLRAREHQLAVRRRERPLAPAPYRRTPRRSRAAAA